MYCDLCQKSSKIEQQTGLLLKTLRYFISPWGQKLHTYWNIYSFHPKIKVFLQQNKFPFNRSSAPIYTTNLCSYFIENAQFRETLTFFIIFFSLFFNRGHINDTADSWRTRELGQAQFFIHTVLNFFYKAPPKLAVAMSVANQNNFVASGLL